MLLAFLHDEEHDKQHYYRDDENDYLQDIQAFRHQLDGSLGLRFHIIKHIVYRQRHIVLSEIVEMTI